MKADNRPSPDRTAAHPGCDNETFDFAVPYVGAADEPEVLESDDPG